MVKFMPSDVKILKAAGEIVLEHSGRVSLEELSSRTGLSEETIYRRLQNPGFRSLFIDTIKNSIILDMPDILRAFVEMAKGGSFKHGKLLLEIAGIYSEETNINVDAKVGSSVVPFKTEDEKAEFVSGLTKKFLKEYKDVGVVIDLDNLGGS